MDIFSGNDGHTRVVKLQFGEKAYVKTCSQIGAFEYRMRTSVHEHTGFLNPAYGEGILRSTHRRTDIIETIVKKIINGKMFETFGRGCSTYSLI